MFIILIFIHINNTFNEDRPSPPPPIHPSSAVCLHQRHPPLPTTQPIIPLQFHCWWFRLTTLSTIITHHQSLNITHNCSHLGSFVLIDIRWFRAGVGTHIPHQDIKLIIMLWLSSKHMSHKHHQSTGSIPDHHLRCKGRLFPARHPLSNGINFIILTHQP